MTYRLLHGIAASLSRLPFGMLYLLSDFIYVIVFYLVRYRRKLVMKNLQRSFPEKSERELKTIRRQYYHWFCDYMVETLKLLTTSRTRSC